MKPMSKDCLVQTLMEREELTLARTKLGDKLEIFNKVGFLLTDEFLPEVSQDWDQVLANGFLHRVPSGI